LFSSPNIIPVMESRRMRWAWHVAQLGRAAVYTEFWWKKTDGKKSLGRPRRRWKDDIKMDL